MSKEKKSKKKNDAKLPVKKTAKPTKSTKHCKECGQPKSTVGQDEEE